MTMLSIFEDRVLDVRCASCAGMGRRMNGEVCEYCGGAQWLFLADHPLPCAACNDPGRASRPAPPGLAVVGA
jgi:rRNA maturation endonuclease Nob1